MPRFLFAVIVALASLFSCNHWSFCSSIAGGESKAKVMDHGRVMACCLDVFPHKLKDTTKIEDTKNYVFRGKVISLGKDKKVSICYDVEHMRVAGAWVGKPFVYSSEKNMGPT